MYGTSATNRATVPQLRNLSLQIDRNEGEGGRMKGGRKEEEGSKELGGGAEGETK
jgi:hypothetical protein